MQSLDSIRDENGQLPAYAWPGGYPIVYLDQSCDTLCPDCANADEIKNDQFKPETWFPHYEGPSVQCVECNADIESAYGEPV